MGTLHDSRNHPLTAAGVLVSLGIIYGDIGTSPLYVFKAIIGQRVISEELVLGGMSCVFWTLTLITTFKYIYLALNADNKGEGGIFALCGWLVNSEISVKGKRVVMYISIIGASLILGDGALTPAISVTSAIQGLLIVSPNLTAWVMPISLVILLALFVVQSYGTAKIGFAFGPIMLLWFIFIGAVGLWQITLEPSGLLAFNPYMAILLFQTRGSDILTILGGVFLAVTGVEAMFADLGHFHQGPIRGSWLFVVFPCLTLNYIGQTSLLIRQPEAISNPFFLAVPGFFFWPMFILATFAGIIASQAIITGSYSLISQAISLGLAPPLTIRHTSSKAEGQIYCPAVNSVLCCLTLIIVLWLQNSNAMTNAYGITVCTVLVLTTVLYTTIAISVWKFPVILGILFALCTLLLDFTFWSSVIFKIPQGGWIAVLYAMIFCIPMVVWYTGEIYLRRYHRHNDPVNFISDFPERFGKVYSQGESVDPKQDVKKSSEKSNDETEMEKLKKKKKKVKTIIASEKPQTDSSRSKQSSSEKDKEKENKKKKDPKEKKTDTEKSTEMENKKENKKDSEKSRENKKDAEKTKEKNDEKKEKKENNENEQEKSGKLQIKDASTPQNQNEPPKSKKKEKDGDETTVLESEESSRKSRDTAEEDDSDPNDHSGTESEKDIQHHDHTKSASSSESSNKPKPSIPNSLPGSKDLINLAPIVGVFLTDKKYRTPTTFELYLKRTGSIPESVFFLNLKKRHVPYVNDSQRCQITVIVPQKVFFLSVSVGFSERISPALIPSILVGKLKEIEKNDEEETGIVFPVIEPEKISLFVPAETITVRSTFIPEKVVLSLYMMMKSLFFGGFRVRLPEDQTVYLSSIASL